MNEFTNPAKRILKLVEQLAVKPDQQPTSQVWAEVLGLDSAEADSDPHAVYAQLNLVREQVDLVESLMQKTEFSEGLYRGYLSRVRKAVSISNINAVWASYKPNLSPDTILALKYCAEILPSEPDVSMDELQRVLDKIRELRLEIDSSQLSSEIHDFLIRQLAIIEKGILEYPIKGGRAITRAFQEGFADSASATSTFEKEMDNKETSKVYGIWSSFKTAGKEFVEADRVATAYFGLIEKGHAFSRAITGLLTQAT